MSAVTVLLVSQPVGLVLALGLAAVAGERALAPEEFAYAAGGGAAALLALGAFYRGMALGSIGVVATIGALGILVPIAVGLGRGEEPTAVQALGVVVATAAILLVAREPDPEWRRAGRQAIGLAALAALGFGTFFVALDAAAATDPVWAIVAARVGGVAALVALVAYVRPALPPDRPAVAWLLAIGFFDVLANGLFAVATTHGLLSLVAVAGSLYSAVTVLLARLVLGERLSRVRTGGVVLALVGVAMIAAGG